MLTSGPWTKQQWNKRVDLKCTARNAQQEHHQPTARTTTNNNNDNDNNNNNKNSCSCNYCYGAFQVEKKGGLTVMADLICTYDISPCNIHPWLVVSRSFKPDKPLIFRHLLLWRLKHQCNHICKLQSPPSCRPWSERNPWPVRQKST